MNVAVIKRTGMRLGPSPWPPAPGRRSRSGRSRHHQRPSSRFITQVPINQPSYADDDGCVECV